MAASLASIYQRGAAAGRLAPGRSAGICWRRSRMMAVQEVTTEAVLEASGIWKRFGDRDVVQEVSFQVKRGKILGIVGPNGAGKTTSIRMSMGIINPDRGQVRVMGEAITGSARERIGYLPEERGLYRSQRVLNVLTYLAQLKGLTRHEARHRAQQLLARLGMEPHQHKKVSALSHGMAQLIQFAATIIHRPHIVVLDEPFSALDPINVRLMKDLILEMRDGNAGLVLSTHQMNQVEELCDEVVMIDQGTVVLSGRLSEIKRSYQGDTVLVSCDPWPAELAGVAEVQSQRDGYSVRLQPGFTPNFVLQQLLDFGCAVERFQVAVPSMEEIFVQVAEKVRG
jgi:ABC-2 type transport system ATP-binding protein